MTAWTLELEARLKAAAQHKMTPEEVFEQKVSFVYGQLMDCAPEITKEQVRARLLAKSGCVGRARGETE